MLVYYRKTFGFYGRFYLVAEIETDGTQILKIILKDEDNRVIDRYALRCIHVALSKVSVEEYLKLKNDPEARKEFILAHSSESFEEINLSLEDRIFAFKSWVQGIAEAGLEGLIMQAGIEKLAGFVIPVSLPLLRFMARYDESVLMKYIDYTFKYCRMPGGGFHKSSLTANLMIIKEIMKSLEGRKRKEILEYIASFNFPIDTVGELFITSKKALHIFLKYYELDSLLDSDLPENLIAYIAGNRKLTGSPYFSKIFDKNNREILKALAGNSEATRFPDFKRLFRSKDPEILKSLASNTGAVKYPDFAVLFEIDNIEIRKALAGNKYATKFPEFVGLFDETNHGILAALAGNENATKFPEFRRLFGINDREIRILLASNPKAPFVEGYSVLFDDPDPAVRRAAAANINAVRYPSYKRFFTDSNQKVRLAAASNPNAHRFLEFGKLAYDPSWHVRRAFVKNPNARKFEGFADLFPPEWGDDIRKIAADPKAVEYPEFRLLFNEKDWSVKFAIASNPAAKRFPEFADLFGGTVKGRKR